MKTKTQFKVGDKVRILPSATSVMVAEDEVGKTGVITSYERTGKAIIVLMDKTRKASGYRVAWNVDSSQIELTRAPGQQLLLWNDIWEE